MKPVPEVAFTPPEDGSVDRQNDRGHVGRLGPRDQRLRQRAITVDVQLKPLGPGNGADVLDGAGRRRAENHDRASGRRRPRRGDFAFIAREPMERCWRQKDRQFDRLPEHARLRRPTTDVHEDAVAEREPLECGAVLAHRDLVVRTAHVVLVCQRGEPFPRRRLDLGEIEEWDAVAQGPCLTPILRVVAERLGAAGPLLRSAAPEAARRPRVRAALEHALIA